MQKTFTLGMNDHSQLVLLPQIIKHISKEAPGVHLNIRYIADLNDIHYFESNDIDLGLGPLILDTPILETTDLFTESAICVMDKNNKKFTNRLTLKKYLAAKHVSVGYEQSIYPDIIDKMLKAQGCKRDTVVAVQNMFTAIQVIKGTDFIATIAKRVAMLFEKQHNLKLVELPFETPSVTLKLIWHRKNQNDMAHKWLRTTIKELFGS